MALADFEGFLEALTDKDQLMDTAMAAGGGMLGGAIHEVAVAKLEFLRTGEGNTPLLKQLGARLGMAVIVSALLGESQKALASGYVGGVMSGFGVELLEKFVPEALAQTVSAKSGTEGYYPLADQYSSRAPQLQGLSGTRVHELQNNIPSNIGGVRVAKASPYAVAAMQTAY